MLTLFKLRNKKRKLAGVLFFFLLIFLVYFQAKDLEVKPCFLADQLDQIMQGRALMNFKSQALYGPYMSGTDPHAFNLGPLSAVIFGFLDAITSSPESMQKIASGMLGLSLIVLCFSLFFYIDVFFSVMFLLVVLASKHWWWNWSMLWANTFMLVISFLYGSILLSYVYSPRWYKAILMLALSLFGFHIHISSVALFPLSVFLLWDIHVRTKQSKFRFYKSIDEKWKFVFSIVFSVLAIIPYGVAEIKNSFQNTKALFANFIHIQNKVYPEKVSRWFGVEEFLKRLLADYIEIFAIGNFILAAVIGIGFVLFGIFVLIRSLGSSHRELEKIGMFSLVILFSQILFFVLTNRSFSSSHYMSFSWPFFLILCLGFLYIPYVYVLGAFKNKRVAYIYAIGLLLFGFWIQKDLKTKESYVERSHWNFKAMRTSIEKICKDHSRIHLWELPPFVPYQNFGSTVMEYVISKGKLNCELAGEDADTWVYPEVIHYPGARKEMEDKGFKIIDTMPPKLLVLKRETLDSKNPLKN